MLWALAHIIQNAPCTALSVLHLWTMHFLPINSFSTQQSASLIITVAMRELLQHLAVFFFFFWWRELFPGWEQLKNVSPTVQISSTLPSFLWQAFPGICCLTISYHSMWAAVRSLGTGLSQDIPHSHEPSVVAGQWLTHTIDVQWMNEWAWHLLT